MIFKHKLFLSNFTKIWRWLVRISMACTTNVVVFIHSNPLKSDDWKMIPNPLPEKASVDLLYMTFDKDRKLMVIY